MKKRDRTRRAILEAGIDCLNESGFHALTLTRVTEKAGVTRGCLRYYFASLEALTLALAGYIGRAMWQSHVDAIADRPAGTSAIIFAVSLIGDARLDRFRTARMELTVAARTVPALHDAIAQSVEEIEIEKARLVDTIFDLPGVAQQPNFAAARDLAQLVEDWLFLQPLPAPATERRVAVRRALELALLAIWQAPGDAVVGERVVRPRRAAARLSTEAARRLVTGQA
ncbi:TetR/AcrR family transcriptional regulator [Sphingosinicellaceae bacterium]|nr:TetR/AcrR family transcriptional regulator [Sphingosinicellaceae bacterium]